MNRKEELEKIVFKPGSDNNIKAAQLIEEIVFLEEQMQELRKVPFIWFPDKENYPGVQMATPAQKMYKEFLQQYNNSLRLLFKLTGDLGESEEESPLRKWVKSREELQ